MFCFSQGGTTVGGTRHVASVSVASGRGLLLLRVDRWRSLDITQQLTEDSRTNRWQRWREWHRQYAAGEVVDRSGGRQRRNGTRYPADRWQWRRSSREVPVGDARQLRGRRQQCSRCATLWAVARI